MSKEAEVLKQAFDAILKKEFGHTIAPPSYCTPFGIRTLDTLLGGGVTSSLPFMISSPPEVGKSTLTFQFCAQFLAQHPDSIIAYIDTEASANSGEANSMMETRITTFGINEARISYTATVADVKEVFSICHKFIDTKKKMEDRSGKEIKLLIVWDSVASTPSSKDAAAEDPKQVIGYKAREITHNLSALKTALALNRSSMILIDQVRANMKIDMYAAEEQSTGSFNNFKAATNISSLQHTIQQWIYMSKAARLLPSEGFGVDGFIVNIHVEKNKTAPSGSSIPLVFDRKYGAIPLLSEYLFLRDMTKTEIKLTKKNESKLTYPLLVQTVGRSKVINIIDPQTGDTVTTSEKFTERNLIEKYNSDEAFKKIFDAAIELSVQQRIVKGLFRMEARVAQEATGDEEVQQEMVEPQLNHAPTL
jgi:RecA/RadA recombinase